MSLSKIFKTLLVCLGVIAFASTSVYAVDNSRGSLGISPSTYDPENIQTKGWFIEKLKPGESVEREMTVYNYFNQEKEVEIRVKDSIQTTEGAFTYKDNSETDVQVGTWVTVPVNKILVPAKSYRNVKFKINVPGDAKSGEYAGVIAVQLPTPTNAGGVVIENRIGARVYVTVPGDLTTGSQVSNFDFIYLKDEASFTNILTRNPSLDIAKINMQFNTKGLGNIFTKSLGKIVIETPNGERVEKVVDLDLFPNSNNISVLVNTEKDLIAGKYKATMDVTHRPIIIFNKENVKDINQQNTYVAEAEITEDTLRRMKELKESLKGQLPNFDRGEPEQMSSQGLEIKIDESLNAKNDNIWMYVSIALALLILAAAAGAGYWYWRKNKSQKTIQK